MDHLTGFQDTGKMFTGRSAETTTGWRSRSAGKLAVLPMLRCNMRKLNALLEGEHPTEKAGSPFF